MGRVEGATELNGMSTQASTGSAPRVSLLLKANIRPGHVGQLTAKVGRIEDPGEWTEEKIIEKAKSLDTDKGAAGNFDD